MRIVMFLDGELTTQLFSCLQILDVGDNELSPVGVGYLLDALRHHPSLASLELG